MSHREVKGALDIARLVDNLGSTLVSPLVRGVGLDAPVTSVVIFDAEDELLVGPGDLLLGVGLHSPEQITSLVRRVAPTGASGLVVKGSAAQAPPVAESVVDTGLAVLQLERAASWVQVAELVRTMVDADDESGPEGVAGLAGVVGGDLFTLANAVSALLDSPITIEDRHSRVLAFSGRQDEADESRIETILGRQVPEEYVAVFEQRGVFKAMARSAEPIYIGDPPGNAKPRVAVAVRAGEELLGSMWAAVDGPLSEERTRAFREAARVVALHMLRLRVGGDVERRLQADLLATVLEGGARSASAASRLGVADGTLRVLAAQPRLPREGAHAEADLERLRAAFAVHFQALHSRSATALVGGVVYTLLPVGPSEDDAAQAMRLGQTFLDRVGAQMDVVIAIGQAAPSFHDLARSRSEADHVLRVLLTSTHRTGRRVARLRDVRLESLLLRVADLLSDDDLEDSPVVALRDYDLTHGTELLRTLETWLDQMGNVPGAADRLGVHPNTLRYRMRRVCEIADLDLDDADQRLDLMMTLRLQMRRG
ncbi:helix-turn-helix domain-containing protein [Nocardioides sp. cx-173]|uniref:helix-turn-helix domain-containing protein n=1 Tax=Nocardioides sp. cx-173 TaxID=2898796 RepID=UPI001E4349A1|nr:helix-turn-helix domain-containing protein [Nocardioides sp. cx-173]MCD4524521.1 helix-turn-helix domain-containing protein [Nocardioides sp. cx-173]UGB42994.1 helix-turn-helix domain-containing protein [Nocardioides sp. cx-173]